MMENTLFAAQKPRADCPSPDQIETDGYTGDFKKKVVFAAKSSDIASAAREFGLNSGTVHFWCKKADAEGFDSLKTTIRRRNGKRRTFSGEIKLKAVLLAKKIGVEAAALEMQISRSNVVEWVFLYDAFGADVFASKVRRGQETRNPDLAREAVLYAREHGVCESATKYGIAISSLQHWIGASKKVDSQTLHALSSAKNSAISNDRDL